MRRVVSIRVHHLSVYSVTKINIKLGGTETNTAESVIIATVTSISIITTTTPRPSASAQIDGDEESESEPPENPSYDENEAVIT